MGKFLGVSIQNFMFLMQDFIVFAENLVLRVFFFADR